MAEEPGGEGVVTFAAKFPAMPAMEVFVNTAGGISISQDDASGYEQVIVFPVEMAKHIAATILAAAEASVKGQSL